MLEYAQEHPYITYAIISMLYGIFLITRFMPERLRAEAAALIKRAEEVESTTIGGEYLNLLYALAFCAGVIWIIAVPYQLFKFIEITILGPGGED